MEKRKELCGVGRVGLPDLANENAQFNKNFRYQRMTLKKNFY